MLLTIARIENGLVFNGGEAFSLLEVEQRSLESGWYVCRVTQTTIVDKKGVVRPYFHAIKLVEDNSFIKDILNIYECSSEGLHLIFNKYIDLLSDAMKSDGRFKSLQSLVSLMDNYSMANISDAEMRSYVHKLSCIVMRRLLADYIGITDKADDRHTVVSMPNNRF